MTGGHSSRLAALPLASVLQPLLAVQTLRYVGLSFLAPAVLKPAPAPSFAVPAALGTTIAAVLALVAMAALRARSRLGIPLTWLATVVGLGDFVNASQTRAAGVIADLGAACYIPIVVVPAAVVAEAMTLGLLMRRTTR